MYAIRSYYVHEAVGVDEIVLTKLDGTAKGGIIVGIVITSYSIHYTKLYEGASMPRASWRRSASQAPPVWMPTSAVSGVTSYNFV